MMTSSPGLSVAISALNKHLLAAGADDDLARLVVELVLALELARDRVLQLGNAVDGGVFGLAVRGSP